jgi:hypothetical protein
MFTAFNGQVKGNDGYCDNYQMNDGQKGIQKVNKLVGKSWYLIGGKVI